MAKSKSIELKDVLELLPSLSHEDLLKLKEAVDQEKKDRQDKAESDFKLLNGEKK